MELLLWLYFYDNRWFFNYKVPINVYKFIWYIPLLMQFMLMTVGVYYMQISTNFECREDMKLWFYHRILFSFSISLNIIFFLVKINQAHEKESSYLENAKMIYPALKNKMQTYDYWIRRNSLFSTSGILLLAQSLISFFWSYFINGLFKDNYYDSCDLNMQRLMAMISIFLFYGNMLVFLILLITILIKAAANLAGTFFPKQLVKISTILYKKKSNLVIHIRSHENDLPEHTLKL